MVFWKNIMENEKMRPTHDGMPLSEEMKINARRVFGRRKPSRSVFRTAFASVTLKSIRGAMVGSISASSSPSDSASIGHVPIGDPTKIPNFDFELLTFQGF